MKSGQQTAGCQQHTWCTQWNRQKKSSSRWDSPSTCARRCRVGICQQRSQCTAGGQTQSTCQARKQPAHGSRARQRQLQNNSTSTPTKSHWHSQVTAEADEHYCTHAMPTARTTSSPKFDSNTSTASVATAMEADLNLHARTRDTDNMNMKTVDAFENYTGSHAAVPSTQRRLTAYG
jgi:hypothetical protein